MEKLQRFIDSTFKWFFSTSFFLLEWNYPCVYIPDLSTSRTQAQSARLLLLLRMIILAWSELPQPPVPIVCVYTQRSPWAAVCLFSRGLVATAMWLWLTVGLTTPFMRHLLAVNQGGHPGAIDGAVSPREMCLSKPTHSATLSPCLGSLTFVYCPSFHPSVSFCFFFSPSFCLSVSCLFPHQRHCSPLIPDPITDSLGTHLSSSNPPLFVIECFTNTSAGDSGLIHMWFL